MALTDEQRIKRDTDGLEQQMKEDIERACFANNGKIVINVNDLTGGYGIYKIFCDVCKFEEKMVKPRGLLNNKKAIAFLCKTCRDYMALQK